MALFSRLLGIIAPEVCHACDGGSGTAMDPGTGMIRLCPECGGSGEAGLSLEECEQVLHETEREPERRVTTPRSVA